MIARLDRPCVAQPYAIGSRCAACSRIACASSQSAGGTRAVGFR